MVTKNHIARKILVSIIIVVTLVILVPLIGSCKPGLSFGEVAICERVDTDTFKPAGIKNNFDFNAEEIFAVIEVSGARAGDMWKFVWINEVTDEIVAESYGEYSEGGRGYVEGYLSNRLTAGRETGLIGEPGDYRVYFYHNGGLISSAGFTIEPPVINVTGVVLCREIDREGQPVGITERFYPGDVIYTLAGLSYRVAGDSLRIEWYKDEDELLGEEEFVIEDTCYTPGYIVFRIENDRLWPTGNYKIELYYNKILEGRYDFEIIKEDIPDATFNDNNIYENDDYKFSILYPDDWDYKEEERTGGPEVSFEPLSGSINTAVNIRFLKEGYCPSTEEYSTFSDKILEEIVDVDTDLEVESEEITGEINGLDYRKISYYYILEDKIRWDIEMIFIRKNNVLYLLIRFSDIYYREFSCRLYDIMLNSLSIY